MLGMILAALEPQCHGEGQAIDIPMLDSKGQNDSTLQKFIFTDGQADDAGPAGHL
jgi:hypothetical protein